MTRNNVFSSVETRNTVSGAEKSQLYSVLALKKEQVLV